MKDLTQKRWQQIDTLFKDVLEKPLDEREIFLQDSCGSDTELMNHVERLLQIHIEAEDILGDTAESFAAPLVPGLLEEISGKSETHEQPGSKVGPYEILEEIGRGGMGTVYLAKKAEAPYEKKVALKLVRRGMDSEDILRRFRNEGQILASLEHSNIARLFDGGIHSDGRPFFVMEYIEGEPINAYCDGHKLSIKERLKLFRTVCEAVHYAHQALIVHRDIKPANVLVTSDGTIKLVDFGIAKLLEPDRINLTDFHTQTGMKLMTPEFAAPEQIRGNPITTASDIYTLGVLLYLLLTGRRPYRLGMASMLEIERIVCETAPVRPSDAAAGKSLPAPSDDDEDPFVPTTEARLRAKDVGSLIRELSGDLDRVILKALRKEPERRYRSALAFAEDIDNYLQGKPVQARPSSFQYRTKKFIRRNRLATSAVAVAIISVLAGLGISLWQANIARYERDVAQQQAAKVAATQDYLVNLFDAADPARTQGEEITVREIVEKGLEQLEEDLAGQPEIHAEMLKVLGRVEMALGDYNLSAELLEEALTEIRNLQGEEHINYAEISSLFGEVMRRKGDYDKADSLFRNAIAIRSKTTQGDDKEITADMNKLASVQTFKGNLDEAEVLYNQSLDVRKRLFGDESLEVASNLSGMGWLYHLMGKPDDAETALRKSLMIREQILESPHPLIAATTGTLAGVLRSRGNLIEAETYFKKAYEQELKLHGEDHPRVTTALSNLSLLYLDMARYKEAANQYQQVLENNRRQLGSDHIYIGIALMHLSTALIEDGKSEEALPLLDEMVEVFRSKVGEQNRYFAIGLMVQSDAFYYTDPHRSITILQKVMDILNEISGQEHPDFGKALTRLGRAQMAADDTESAISSLRQSLDIQQNTLPPSHPNTAWTMMNLGKVLKETGDLEEAEQLLLKAVEMSSENLPPDHWQRIAAQLELAACLKAKGQLTASRNELEKVLNKLQGRMDFHAARLQARAKNIGI